MEELSNRDRREPADPPEPRRFHVVCVSREQERTEPGITERVLGEMIRARGQRGVSIERLVDGSVRISVG